MFAAQHRLGNLQVVLDWNRQQALGLTRDIIDIPNLPERWRAFGWKVIGSGRSLRTSIGRCPVSPSHGWRPARRFWPTPSSAAESLTWSKVSL